MGRIKEDKVLNKVLNKVQSLLCRAQGSVKPDVRIIVKSVLMTMTEQEYRNGCINMAQKYVNSSKTLSLKIDALEESNPYLPILKIERQNFITVASDLCWLEYSDYYKNSPLRQWANEKIKNR